MPPFICPNCQADITVKALATLGANPAIYMPPSVRMLCPHCDHLVTFELGYALVQVTPIPVKEKAHAPRH